MLCTHFEKLWLLVSNASIFTRHKPSGFAETKYSRVYLGKLMQILSVLTAVPSQETGEEHFSLQSREIVSLIDIPKLQIPQAQIICLVFLRSPSPFLDWGITPQQVLCISDGFWIVGEAARGTEIVSYANKYNFKKPQNLLTLSNSSDTER